MGGGAAWRALLAALPLQPTGSHRSSKDPTATASRAAPKRGAREVRDYFFSTFQRKVTGELITPESVSR